MSPTECGARTYTLVGGGGFLTLTVPTDPFTAPLTLDLTSTDPADVGTHTIELQVGLVDHPGVQVISVFFDVTITACEVTSVSIDASDPLFGNPSLNYKLIDPEVPYTYPALIQVPTCGYPVTWVFAPTAAATAWLSDDGTSIGIQSSDTALVGTTETLSFTGTVTQTNPISTSGESLTLNILAPSCPNTTLNTQVINPMTTSVLRVTAEL